MTTSVQQWSTQRETQRNGRAEVNGKCEEKRREDSGRNLEDKYRYGRWKADWPGLAGSPVSQGRSFLLYEHANLLRKIMSKWQGSSYRALHNVKYVSLGQRNDHQLFRL